jgi:hypothetical protein
MNTDRITIEIPRLVESIRFLQVNIDHMKDAIRHAFSSSVFHSPENVEKMKIVDDFDIEIIKTNSQLHSLLDILQEVQTTLK